MTKPKLTGGLIPRKGEAERPPAIEPAAPVATALTPPPTEGTKALTLRLQGRDYDRLRTYAFASGRKHQDIIETLVLQFLKERGL